VSGTASASPHLTPLKARHWRHRCGGVATFSGACRSAGVRDMNGRENAHASRTLIAPIVSRHIGDGRTALSRAAEIETMVRE